MDVINLSTATSWVPDLTSDKSAPYTLHSASGPPPGPDGWVKTTLPHGEEIWAAAGSNDVERIRSIMIVERKPHSTRYLCLKCGTMFVGSKKRIKQHMRGQSKDVKSCVELPTEEEEAIFQLDDAQGGRGSEQEGQEQEQERAQEQEQEQEQEQQGSQRAVPGKRKHSNSLQENASPFLVSTNPPLNDRWTRTKMPDGQEIWTAEPRNDIERMSCILVLERRETSTRYLCRKCNYMFWGSKKRVKEHLRRQSRDVKCCVDMPTPEEERVLRADDEGHRAKALRGGQHYHLLERDDASTSAAAATGAGKGGSSLTSPFPASADPPAGEGWSKMKVGDGEEIWVGEPRNAIERLGIVCIIERTSNATRYLCLRCSLMFWGSKKRVKEHLRREGSSVTGCTVDLSLEEDEALGTDHNHEGGDDSRFTSPYPAGGPPPEEEGWSKACLSTGEEVWVAEPKNAIEKLEAILVVERRSNSSRYYCSKCNMFFFGTKKRVKEHLRRLGKDVKPCAVAASEHEEAVLKADDTLLMVRRGYVDPAAESGTEKGGTTAGGGSKERKSQLAAEADLAWFKLFERYDIPKRIIETEEAREAVRKTIRAGPAYQLPSRSRLGDDTPGHKADPSAKGAKARSKPAGLMYLAVQAMEEEERAAMVHKESAGEEAGGYERSISMDVEGLTEQGASKVTGSRKRQGRLNNRLLDRKSALSLRLKQHWKLQEAAKEAARASTRALSSLGILMEDAGGSDSEGEGSRQAGRMGRAILEEGGRESRMSLGGRRMDLEQGQAMLSSVMDGPSLLSSSSGIHAPMYSMSINPQSLSARLPAEVQQSLQLPALQPSDDLRPPWADHGDYPSRTDLPPLEPPALDHPLPREPWSASPSYLNHAMGNLQRYTRS